MQTMSIVLVLVGIIFQFFGVSIQLIDNSRNQVKPVLLQEELFRETAITSPLEEVNQTLPDE